jgi:hypothetical protein
MGCVNDPEHQICHVGQVVKTGGHPGCKGHEKTPEGSPKQSPSPLMPIACVQACSTALTSLHPGNGVQISRPLVTLGTLVHTAEVFIDLSEPRSIFHPPA